MKGYLGRGSLSVPSIGFFCRLAFVVMLLGTCLLPGGSNVCWAEETEPSTPANDTGKRISAQALELAKSGREEAARTLLRTAYDSAGGKTDPEIPYFLAALEARNDDLKSAIRHLKEAKDMLEQSKSNDQYQNLLILKRLGDCRYRDNDGETALVDYKSALLLSELLRREPSVVREEILESLVACLLNAKDYGEAEKYGLMLQASARTRLEKDQRAVLSVVWSQLQLADVYRLSNQREKLLALRKELRPLLESLVELRMSKEQTGELLPYDALVQAFRQNYIAELDPKTPAEIGWAACDFRERTLPIIGWGDSRDATAAIVCVHGLGLENRAFKNTAEALNKRGYVVYALDVRGFGSWTMTRGLEEIDYDQTIADIRTICETLKARSSNMKVFVLGESMGGAIALRAAARLQDVLDGVISSVPSAERFQQRKMTLQTALHFVVDRHKAFDVDYVAAMATAKVDQQEKWKNDPKAKLELTPIELIDFAVFMRRTKPQVEKITTLPVLMVQGLGDRLVKPEGTFALFDAVGSKDKTLFLAGLAEHLMFENFSPDPILIDTVDSWLKHHIPTATTSMQSPDVSGEPSQN